MYSSEPCQLTPFSYAILLYGMLCWHPFGYKILFDGSDMDHADSEIQTVELSANFIIKILTAFASIFQTTYVSHMIGRPKKQSLAYER
jgi:hypothetical protein